MKLRISDAVTLHYIRDDRFKTARLSLYTVLPATAEGSPLATLLFGTLRRGSEQYPRLSLLNRRLDELYGTTLTGRNYLHGDAHVISYTAEMPEQKFLPETDPDTDVLSGVMALLADMILHPLRDEDGMLRADAVEKEKQTRIDSLRALRNDTRAYAGNRLREIMCEGEPYGLSIGGTVDGVSRITPREVTDLYDALMKQARMEIFYTGQATREKVMEAWRDAFGSFHPDRLPTPATTLHIPPAIPRREVEDMAVSQGKLCMSWSCGENYTILQGDPDRLAAHAVVNEIFGGMQGSLLFRHVREERGLCYFCDSALDMTKGILWVSCGIRPDRLHEAEAAISAELRALQEGRISEDDLRMAKLSLQNIYRQMEDSQASMESFAFGRMMDGTAYTPAEELSRIMTVTVEDVARVASAYRPDTVFFLNGTLADEEDGYDD